VPTYLWKYLLASDSLPHRGLLQSRLDYTLGKKRGVLVFFHCCLLIGASAEEREPAKKTFGLKPILSNPSWGEREAESKIPCKTYKIFVDVSWCYGNHCGLTIVLKFDKCLLPFQSFALRHLARFTRKQQIDHWYMTKGSRIDTWPKVLATLRSSIRFISKASTVILSLFVCLFVRLSGCLSGIS